MDVKFKTVRAGGHAEIERRDCIFRTERTSAAVREDEGALAIKESHKSEGTRHKHKSRTPVYSLSLVTSDF